jgi:hypothetical protein
MKQLYWEELSDNEEPEGLDPEEVRQEAWREAWSLFQSSIAETSKSVGLSSEFSARFQAETAEEDRRRVQVVFSESVTIGVTIDMDKSLRFLRQAFIRGVLQSLGERVARNFEASDSEDSSDSEEENEEWISRRFNDVDVVLDWIRYAKPTIPNKVFFRLVGEYDAYKMATILRLAVALSEGPGTLRIVFLTMRRVPLEDILEHNILAKVRARNLENDSKILRQRAVEIFSDTFQTTFGFRWDQAGTWFHRRRLGKHGIKKLGFFALKQIYFNTPFGFLYHSDIMTTGEHRVLLKKAAAKNPEFMETVRAWVEQRDPKLVETKDFGIKKIAEIVSDERSNQNLKLRVISKIEFPHDIREFPDPLAEWLAGLEDTLNAKTTGRGFKPGPFMRMTAMIMEIIFNEMEASFDLETIWNRFHVRIDHESLEQAQLWFACGLMTAEYLGVIRMPKSESNAGKFKRALFGADLAIAQQN